MEQDPRSEQNKKPGGSDGDLENDRAVEEFFNRLKQDMRRPKPGQDSVAAALQAIQRLALEADVEQSAEETAHAGPACQSCGSPNRQGNKFCASCGVPLLEASSASSRENAPEVQVAYSAGQPLHLPAGPHHYHHHYHHHYFSPGEGSPASAPASATTRDTGRLRAPLTGPSLSRTEAAARKLTQDWALACNTKQLNDLVELYAPDALVLRPNVPPVRGTAAIREFFFGLLDAGMGEVELETLRAEVLGDTAYDAGRCKSLVPVALNKRREERGKYVLLLNRVAGGDWKIVADTWSSDLNLAGETSAPTAPAPGSALPKPPRKP